MKREAFKGAVGRKHANLRFWVAKRGLENAIAQAEDIYCRNSSLFISWSNVSARERTGERNRDGIACKPGWLNSGVISGKTMVLARQHHELLKSELPIDSGTIEKEITYVYLQTPPQHSG